MTGKEVLAELAKSGTGAAKLAEARAALGKNPSPGAVVDFFRAAGHHGTADKAAALLDGVDKPSANPPTVPPASSSIKPPVAGKPPVAPPPKPPVTSPEAPPGIGPTTDASDSPPLGPNEKPKG